MESRVKFRLTDSEIKEEDITRLFFIYVLPWRCVAVALCIKLLPGEGVVHQITCSTLNFDGCRHVRFLERTVVITGDLP